MTKKKLPHQTKIAAFMEEHKDALPEDLRRNARVLYRTDPRRFHLQWFDFLVDAFLTDCKRYLELNRAA